MQVRTLIVGGVLVALVAFTRGRTPRPAKAAPAATPTSQAAARARIALPEPTRSRIANLELDFEAELPEYTEPEDPDLVDEIDDVIESDIYGGVRGRVTDHATGEILPGVTIIATSPAHEGSQAAITDEHGFFEITSLLPGSYVVTLYYVDKSMAYPLVEIEAGQATPIFARLETAPWQPLPPPAELEDGEGVSFSGATLLETQYIIE